MRPARQLFLWFVAPSERDEDVRAALGRLADELRAEFDHAPTLHRRSSGPGGSDAAGRTTWMEVHPPMDEDRIDAYAARVEALADVLGLSALAETGRRAEWFECA